MDNVYQSVYREGTYYSPANKHYGYSGVVNCDRCRRTNLRVSIGWNDYDLCMKCMSDLEENGITRTSIPPPSRDWEHATLMAQGMFKDYDDRGGNALPPLNRRQTKMKQGSFTRTRMMQGMF